MKKILTTTLILAIAGLGIYAQNVQAAWFNEDWSHRVSVTIDSAQVDSTLTNFPVYVDLSDLPADFHTNVKSDGCDIRVIESDEVTETAFELVSYDSGSDTGELHFLADSVSSSADTTFYIYYGNSGASCYSDSATFGAENVWVEFGGVWHMGGGTLSDSSGNVGDSTTNSGVETSSSQIGVATDYNGTDQQTIIPDASSIGTDVLSSLTYTAWFEADAWNRSMEKSDSYFFIQFSGAGDNGPLIKQGGGNIVASVGTLSTGVYHHLGGRFDGAAGTLDAFVNGSINDTTSGLSSSLDTAGNDLYVGSDDGTGGFFNGRIDELRISSNVLSTDWISAEYTNQNTPTTFYTVGTQEDAPSTAEEKGPQLVINNGGMRVDNGRVIID